MKSVRWSPAVLALLCAPAGAQVVGRAAVAPLPAAAASAPIHPALLSPDGASGAPLAAMLN
ncbi:MAG: hypothetical protein HY079_13240, partial [Elusimicrobia bacterium]|nr:hypothetical protein [Elusimicrobiota bacterium]